MKKKLFPLGIGTWGIGGFVEPDFNNDQRSIDAIKYSLLKGMNFIELNYWTAKGHSVNLVVKAIKESGVSRDNLFLHQALYCYDNDVLDDVRNEMRIVRDLLGTDYIDSVEFDITGINKYGFDNVVLFLQSVLSAKEANFVSLTNADLNTLKKFKDIFGDKFFCHEINFNFEIREFEDLGIVDFAENNNIKNVIYQPLRRNRTANRNWDLLVRLANKYDVTQNQIIINWLVSRGFLLLIKSNTLSHIDDNLSALGLIIDKSDLDALNDFRPAGWVTPSLVLDNADIDDSNIVIHQLSNVFDDMYDKK